MIYLISGGSGSGKSKFAEDEALKYNGRKFNYCNKRYIIMCHKL